MAKTRAASSETASPKFIAPWWHTTLLVTLFLGLAVVGALFQRNGSAQPGGLQPHPSVAPLYLSLMAAQWGLLYYVWKVGLRRSGTELRALIGGRWSSPKEVVTDAALGLGLWTGWTVLMMAWERWSGSGHAASIQPLLPQGIIEILLWVALSISAGPET